MQVRNYKSDNSGLSFKNMVLEMFSDLKQSRDLAWRLTVRDFKGQYRQSLLGGVWAFITPLMSALVWIFLNASGAVQISDAGIPYPAYVFSGTMLWSILSDSVSMPLKQTVAAKGMMGKINFPKEGLLLSSFYNIFIGAGIKTVLIILGVLAIGVAPTTQLFFVPVAVFGMIFFGYAIGLLATPLGMLYTDIGKVLPMFMQLLMYLSPVVYTIKGNDWLSKIININPTTALVTTGRSAFTGLPFENLTYFFALFPIVFIFLIVGWVFYRFSIPIIVERTSNT